MTRNKFTEKRTPKHYAGNQPTGKKISEFLPNFSKNIEIKYADNPLDVINAWQEIVPKHARTSTCAVSFDRGYLKVLVENSVLLSLLFHYEKPALLEKLKKKFPDLLIKDITFKMGIIEGNL